MLIKRYIKFKYDDYIEEHIKGRCSCDLQEGGKGLCNTGRYLEGLITPKEYLKEIEDDFSDLKYGTFIRTSLDDIASIIGIEKIDYRLYFILDREIEFRIKDEYIRFNKIKVHDVERHSNDLKKLVQIGDIVNGHKIIKIDRDKLYYGYWGNEYISGDVQEVLTMKNYNRHSVLNIK